MPRSKKTETHSTFTATGQNLSGGGNGHVEVWVYAGAAAAGGPGMEEGFGGFIGETSTEGKVEEEGSVFIGCVFGTEDEDSH